MSATQSAIPEPDLPADTAPNRDAGSPSRELSADEILSADDLPMQCVEVPEWLGHVFVRSMSAAERDDWEVFLLSCRTPDGELNMRNLRATLVANTCCNSIGERIFTSDQADALGKKNSRAIVRIYDAAQELNAITDDDVKELAKNLPGDGSGSSPSVSASGSESSTPTASDAS